MNAFPYRFQDRQLSSQAELHDAIARAWIGADSAPTLEETVEVLADFENEAEELEGTSGWNLADEDEGVEGYDRDLLLEAIEGLRDELLEEADEALVAEYEDAVAAADEALTQSIQKALDDIEEDDDDTHLTFNRAVRRDDDGNLYVDWTVEAGQGNGTWHEIGEDEDAETIANSMSSAWEKAWDDDDGLAIDSYGVDRGDDGYGEVITVGEKKRTEDQ